MKISQLWWRTADYCSLDIYRSDIELDLQAVNTSLQSHHQISSPVILNCRSQCCNLDF